MPYGIGEESEIDSNPISLEGRPQSIKTPELIARDVFPTEAWSFEDPQENTNPKMILLDPWDLDVEHDVLIEGDLTVEGHIVDKLTTSRNTVLTGAVDSDGAPDILYEAEDAIGRAGIYATATAVEITYADGFIEGERNHFDRIITDIEPGNWVDLSGSHRHYLYTDYNAGTIAYDKTLVQPQSGQVFDPTKHSILHMETVLQDEYGNTWTASGAAQSAVQEKFGTYSYVFDGANDYLQSTAFTSFAQPFTVEGWFRTDQVASDQYLFGHSASKGFHIYFDAVNAGDHIDLYISSDGANWDIASAVAGANSIVANTWFHFAFEWDGSFYRSYVDGVLDASVASTLSINPFTAFQVGNCGTHATLGFDGYIDEVRITIGNPRYGEAFPKPTAAFTEDAVFFDTQAQKMKVGGPTAGWTDKTYCFLGEAVCDRRDAALLHFESTNNDTNWWTGLIDEYGNKWTFVGNTTINTGDKKFGDSSLEVQGTNDSVHTTDITSLGIGPWCFECWWHTDDITIDNQQVFMAGDASHGLSLRFDTTGDDQLLLSLSSDGANDDIANVVEGAKIDWVNDIWYHICLEFDGSAYTVYVGGVEDISVVDSTVINTNGAITEISLGLHNDGASNDLNGGIDEFRLTVGHTRYGAAFTPATAAFSKDGCINDPITYPFSNTVAEAGWIKRTDWTNVHMGSSKTLNVDSNFKHNMGVDIEELRIRAYYSKSGSWADAHYIGFLADANGVNTLGLCVDGISQNECIIQTGTTGVGVLNGNGTITLLGAATSGYYYIRAVKH